MDCRVIPLSYKDWIELIYNLAILLTFKLTCLLGCFAFLFLIASIALAIRQKKRLALR